ncbi:integrase, catalytic region, zinc finger, CCHC-type containing protein [Tanacetum coccineum]
MSTQHEFYAAGSENRPLMLNKDNYVPWSSRNPNREVPVDETFHEHTDEELTEKDIKQMEADDQAIQTIFMGLSEDIYDVEKKAKLFNEWKRFNSSDGESIESYYHRFLKLMNDFKRNKHFLEKIASNLKFLNSLQPELKRHITIEEVNELRAERLAKTHDPLAFMANTQTSYTYPMFHPDHPSQITYMQHPPPNNNYVPQPSFNTDYMQQPMPNPDEINDPTTAMNMTLVLMANAFKLNYPTPTNNNQRISSNPHNRQIAKSGMNMIGGTEGNQFRQYAGQNTNNPIEYNAGQFTWNQNGYNAVQNAGNQVVQNAVQNPGIQNVGNQNGLIVVPGIANQIANQNGIGNVVVARAEGNGNGNNGNQIRCYNCRGVGHYARKCTVRPRRRDDAYLQTQLLIAQKEEAGIQLQAEEFDLMQASTSGTQTDKAPVYDSDGSAEVHQYENCYNNEIFNMFTQEEQYTELLEPITKPHRVQQNNSNVIAAAPSVEPNRGTIEQHPTTFEETRAYYESLYNNVVIEVDKVNMVNRKIK